MTIGVVIQQRDRFFREGLALRLDSEPDICVLAAAPDRTVLTRALGEVRADVVIMEVGGTPWDPVDLVGSLRARHRTLRIVGLYTDLDAATARSLVRNGARQLLPRAGGVAPLVDALHSPTARLDIPVLPTTGATGQRRALTPREMSILRLLAVGLTTREVSERLGISPRTVENAKRSVFTKLDVRSQTHALSIALREGLLAPGEQTAG